MLEGHAAVAQLNDAVGATMSRRLQRALVPADTDGPGLRLELWDEQESGRGPESLPEARDALIRYGSHGEFLGLAPDEQLVRFAGPTFDIRLDRAANEAVGWMQSAAHLNWWHQARPLQTLFISWLAGQGRPVVHAAMVARDGVGALLSGPSHSGKSTITAACGAGGLDVCGDETIALEVTDDAIRGHTVHATVKLRRPGLDRHPGLPVEDVAAELREEVVAFLGEAFPDQVIGTATIGALCFPKLVDVPETTWAPLPAGQALRELMSETLSAEPDLVASTFHVLSELAERVPAYRVWVGTDTARIPDGIDGVISAATAVA